MAEDSGGGMMMMVMVAVIAFVGYYLITKNKASQDVQQAAAQPSQTVVQPQTTIIQTPVFPFSGPVVFIDDDPDFGFPENPCHFWIGSEFDPDERRCFFPFHRDCDDRGMVWDRDNDRCIHPPTPHVELHRPANITININETAKKGGSITNNITNTTPSATWNFKLQNGKTIGPDTITTFASNCHSALGKNDAGCGQIRNTCASGAAANKDMCTALTDAGFA